MDYCGKMAIRSSRQHRTTLPIVEFKCNKMQPTSCNQLWSYIQKYNQLFYKKIGDLGPTLPLTVLVKYLLYLALNYFEFNFSVWVRMIFFN